MSWSFWLTSSSQRPHLGAAGTSSRSSPTPQRRPALECSPPCRTGTRGSPSGFSLRLASLASRLPSL
eukprot:3329488-Lingulodinium_polyedra.AAC.1